MLTADARKASMNLRVGDWVEVLSPNEILATLDEAGSLDGLPFMPEMLQYCGRKFRVYKSAHKTCDTINDYVIRRMDRTVHLEGLRCDGQGHGGCQAGCLLYWKEDWLKPVAAEAADGRGQPIEATVEERRRLDRTTRVPPPSGDNEIHYRCQATEVLRATTPVRRRDRWDPRFYIRDLTSGNVRLGEFIRYGLFAMFNAFFMQWKGRRYPHLVGIGGQRTPTSQLNLRPGDRVHVLSTDTIMETLNAGMRNRGLLFDVEMVKYCGSERTVRSRVEQIVDEKTGRMIRLPNPAIILDEVVCSGNLSMCRMFCPRSVYPYWREIWLQRVEEPTVQS
jgi:hypothetical protein